MFQVCSCNTDNIEYCSRGKCIHSLLHTFPHLHGIGRSSGKEIVIMFGFITSSSSSCSLQPYSCGSITKLFANGERNQTYDCRYTRFMCSKILDDVGGNLSRLSFIDFLQQAMLRSQSNVLMFSSLQMQRTRNFSTKVTISSSMSI